MPQVGIINPGQLHPINSIEIVIWVALGGRGTLYGAIIGAIVVNYAKTYFTGAFPEIWLFLLGALFVLSTTSLPKGLVGLAEQLFGSKKVRNAHDGADEPEDKKDAEVAS